MRSSGLVQCAAEDTSLIVSDFSDLSLYSMLPDFLGMVHELQ